MNQDNNLDEDSDVYIEPLYEKVAKVEIYDEDGRIKNGYFNGIKVIYVTFLSMKTKTYIESLFVNNKQKKNTDTKLGMKVYNCFKQHFQKKVIKQTYSIDQVRARKF